MAAVALLMSAAGVYTVSAYAVSRRKREVGIRMALGARGIDVMFLFLVQAARTAAVGMTIGFAGAMAMSDWLQSLLFGAGPHDIPAFVMAAALNGALAAAAVYIAVRRATTINPALTLRAE
jgi:ABC-type antimicrobial peptide transport system permease subunit